MKLCPICKESVKTGVSGLWVHYCQVKQPSLRDADLAGMTDADLIEQQSERIKELEASLASMVQGVKISIPTQTMEQEFQSHYRRGYEAGKSALRQRIDDAPVVAWLHTQSNGCSSLIRTPPSAFDPQDLADAEVSIYALISKDDLL